MKVSTFLKNKTASFLILLLRFLKWSEKHKKIILPLNIILLILLGWGFVSLAKKMIRENDFATMYNILRGKCDSCDQELPVFQNPDFFIKPSTSPAKIPAFFYENGQNNSGNEKKPV